MTVFLECDLQVRKNWIYTVSFDDSLYIFVIDVIEVSLAQSTEQQMAVWFVNMVL
jgi:hypothetical protein